LRIDSWVESGIVVPALFDPMIAKMISLADNRTTALTLLDSAISQTVLYGIETNLTYVRAIVRSAEAQTGQLLTRSLASLAFTPACVSVLQGGTQTTLQDYPGRIGYWHVGVPPSGPMDNLSFRLANQLVGNPLGAPALEITLNGPGLKFHRDTQVAVTGAHIELSLDGAPCPQFQTFWVKAEQVLQLGRIQGAGCRAYLAVAGGFNCPEYLGSAATFTLGQFGGTGRALATGDTLQLVEIPQLPDVSISAEASLQLGETPPQAQAALQWGETARPRSHIELPTALRPAITEDWVLRVIPGPHTAPDFFTAADMASLFSETWQVHYQSSRTGVRLLGPKPQWARETGGEAGLHPSNIHDNAYAFGSVDFTGDMPVILGVDGPSLGGFVCPATVIAADLWKLGQLKAGARLRFVPVTHAEATALEAQQLQGLAQLNSQDANLPATDSITTAAVPFDRAVFNPIAQTGRFGPDAYVCRLAGDHFLLVELGPLELDIARRFRVHALMLWLEANRLPGLQELTPGVRSLQIHYNPQQLPLTQLLSHLAQAEAELARTQPTTLPSRIVYLPLSWDDEACREAIAKYTASVRPGAPWCPSNLEFIRRINGLRDLAAVKDMVFNTDYLVLGLGDVYLGAPLATPLDPRQRLVTTKYNPARTWTAENSVGIGGAYLCVYGMEGPGGYQFVGRTLQMWNTFKTTDAFSQPWLLRFFDQIRFYEVSAEELKTIRRDFPQGRYALRIEESEFNLTHYQAFLDENRSGIEAFTAQREAAFAAELEHWRASGQLTYTSPEDSASPIDEAALPPGITAVESPVAGSLWQLQVAEGDQVVAGQVLAILESMKMEIEVTATTAGRVEKILRQPGQSLGLGQCLLWINTQSSS
ncbi:MAG TPA: 5-oxoprolinase/urea amidolyase family protein, partial [Cellvibrionaceae bacterium]